MGKWLAILCLLGCGARSGLDTSSDAGSDPPPPRRDGGRTPMRDGGGPRPRDAGMLPTDGTCVIERLGDDGAVEERSTEWRDEAGLIVRSMIEHPLSAGDEPAVWTYTYDDARRIVHVDMRQGEDIHLETRIEYPPRQVIVHYGSETVVFDLDEFDRVIRHSADSYEYEYTWDDRGRIVQVIERRGDPETGVRSVDVRRWAAHDVFDRPRTLTVETTHDGGPTSSRSYAWTYFDFPARVVVERSAPVARIATFENDARGLLARAAADEDADGDEDWIGTYEYDAELRMIRARGLRPVSGTTVDVVSRGACVAPEFPSLGPEPPSPIAVPIARVAWPIPGYDIVSGI